MFAVIPVPSASFVSAAEGDVHYVRDCSKTKALSDKKNSRIGGRQPKEASKSQLANLQGKLKELEANAVAVEEDRRRLKDENGRFCRLMERMTAQNEKLSSELEYYLSKNEQLVGKLLRTEAMADDAVARCHASERRIDELEQQVGGGKKVPEKSVEFSESNGAKITPLKSVLVNRSAGDGQGDDLRNVLGDVRSLLAQYSMNQNSGQEPECERGRTRASPVGQLLMDRQRVTQTNMNHNLENTDQLCRRLSNKIDALTRMEEDMNRRSRGLATHAAGNRI